MGRLVGDWTVTGPCLWLGVAVSSGRDPCQCELAAVSTRAPVGSLDPPASGAHKGSLWPPALV